MENDREFEQVLMNVRNTSGGISSAIMLSARMSMLLVSEREKVLSKQGFFISRIPGTYGEKQMTLILPKSQVFKTDEGKTFIAFIPKNKGSMVASAKGEVKELSFDDVMNAYDPVKRGFRKVEEMMKPEISPDIYRHMKGQCSFPCSRGYT